MTTKYKYLGVRGRSDYVHAECWADYRDQNSRYDAQGQCVSSLTYDLELSTFRGIRKKRCSHCGRPLLTKPAAKIGGQKTAAKPAANIQPTIAKLLEICSAVDALYSNLADCSDLSKGEDEAWERLLDAINKEQRNPLLEACRNADAMYSSLADTYGLSKSERKDWEQLLAALEKAKD